MFKLALKKVMCHISGKILQNVDTTEVNLKQLKNTDRNNFEHMELDVDEGVVQKYLKLT